MAKDAVPDPVALIRAAGGSELLSRLAREGELAHYRRGTQLIVEGDHGQTLYIVVSGQLQAHARHPITDQVVVFSDYGAGEYVGEMSLDGGPRSASVRVSRDAWVVRVQRPTLERFIAGEPAFAFELMTKVIWIARRLTRQMREITLNGCYGRLRSVLLEWARPGADGRPCISPAPTHVDLAEHAGCGRPMVSRLMKDLKQGGYVADEAGSLVLLRPLPVKW